MQVKDQELLTALTAKRSRQLQLWSRYFEQLKESGRNHNDETVREYLEDFHRSKLSPTESAILILLELLTDVDVGLSNASIKDHIKRELTVLHQDLEDEINFIRSIMPNTQDILLSYVYLDHTVRLMNIGMRLDIAYLASGAKEKWFTHSNTIGISSSDNARKALDSLISSLARAAEWKPIKEKFILEYDNAVSLADKLWSEGDNALDWEMARYLCKLEDFMCLSEKRLKRHLEPIAEKYGKRSGYRNGKKNAVNTPHP